LPTGKFVRVSAKTRSWENAERIARVMEVNADPLHQTVPDANLRITVEEARSSTALRQRWVCRLHRGQRFV